MFGGAAAATGLAGCAGDRGGEAKAYLPETWDQETDILVVGCGGAGISAAITAASEGLGECLVLEVAPEGQEGGNTRVSAQVIFCPDSVEGAIEYQTNLNGPYHVEEEMVRAWAENICENVDWLATLGIEAEETKSFNPEWPDVAGSEACNCYLVGGAMGGERLWTELASVAEDIGVSIQHDSRAIELVFDPLSKEVFGMKVEVDGEERFVKARKGIILACGGFENNPEMVAAYNQIGYYEIAPSGTPYNRGDGIRMALTVGAELWHMNNFSNSSYCMHCGDEGNNGATYLSWKAKDYIYVGSNAKRFMYEETAGLARHGKYLYGGSATNLMQPCPTYAVFGQACFDAGPIALVESVTMWNNIMGLLVGKTNEELLAAGRIVKADTVEELAAKLGLDPAALAVTVSEYNVSAQANVDSDWKRGTDVYSAFAGMTEQADKENGNTSKPAVAAFDLVPIEGPYYGVRLYVQGTNTQGGPKRSAKGEVLDVYGNPVPRLFSAGELGCIYPYNYNGGGNVSEALSSGRLAARQVSSLEAWAE